ncbi:hypothetical protein INT45_009054 [Circinella minor]|uniref:Uncharacterized protein n=1 Tax=Circinella minor TaxID=1195481 RepID=A0A8H7VRU9_9FUNG|nr:hypothetical protein INT45_009054 [Circinella minor]
MVKNAFLSIKNPDKWNLSTVLQELEYENLSGTHRSHLKLLRKLLKEVKTSGNAQQKQAANIILNNWDAECRRLTTPTSTPPPATTTTTNTTSNMEDRANSVESHDITFHVRDSTIMTGPVTIHMNDSSQEMQQGQSSSTVTSAQQTQEPQQQPSAEHDPCSQETWESANPHPKRLLQHFYPSNSYSLNNFIQSNTVIPNINMSEEYQFYRKKSIEGAQGRETLNDSRILSLSNIFLISSNERCVLSSMEDHKVIFKALKKTDRLKRVDLEFDNACKIITNIYNDDGDYVEMEKVLPKMKQLQDETYLTGVRVLSSMIDMVVQWNEDTVLKEEDLGRKTLDYFLHATFCRIKNTESSWNTYTLKPPSSSPNYQTFLPDFTLYNSKLSSVTNYEFTVVEIKAKASNKDESDMVRIGKELKICIDKLANAGVIDPVAVGIIIRGSRIQFFKMLLDGPGAYTMVELGNLNLPRSPSDTPLLPSLVERFCQLKDFAEESVAKLYEAHRKQRHSNKTHNNYQKQWLRPTCQTPIIQEMGSKKKRRRRS